MIGVIASMVMTACFFIAAVKHKDRGETVQAEKCAVLAVVGLGFLFISAAVA